MPEGRRLTLTFDRSGDATALTVPDILRALAIHIEEVGLMAGDGGALFHPILDDRVAAEWNFGKD